VHAFLSGILSKNAKGFGEKNVTMHSPPSTLPSRPQLGRGQARLERGDVLESNQAVFDEPRRKS
jgi:hypothetical protein